MIAQGTSQVQTPIADPWSARATPTTPSKDHAVEFEFGFSLFFMTDWRSVGLFDRLQICPTF
jgi:hypothetical protein